MKDEVIKLSKVKLGEFLSSRRKEKKLSIWKLSQLSGVAIPTIRVMEAGQKAYTIDTLLALMDALDLYVYFADREGHHLDQEHMIKKSDDPIGPEIPYIPNM